MGSQLPQDENPYTVLIEACGNDVGEIAAQYEKHRTNRNTAQREKFLADDYTKLNIDEYIYKLVKQPGFKDERNCLVFWARPPDHIIQLAAALQEELKSAAPSIWLMPTHRMHMTTLEVAFSKTPEEIDSLVTAFRPAIFGIVSSLMQCRTKLVRPQISYDLSAFALSFVPATDEGALGSPTYHHVRRDVWAKVKDAGVDVGSRYQVPSAHITLGRYLSDEDTDTREKREAWVSKIDELNRMLAEKWERANEEERQHYDWWVGQERGLDMRAGTLWYGGGRTILVGEGY